ncbi:hypothetical protein GCM10009784_07110 [Arthrobacter parietis]|uniref:Hpt domain-containing protein n=2 Tax=Arthrobacter TaxID=1663 RepID=A0ABT6CYU9_9MICC|nr:Hpt domain-containing protein [Arthrobacter vasquezii]MDF9279265.1 Hpt domain-containing protein [Arthrobacter vasquezii]
MSKNKRAPLVDRKVLHRLEDEFEDPGPAHSFVRDFVAFWDERYLRLAEAVQRHDEAASLDALLSVRIGSAMIGAARLAKLAAELESSLKRGHLGAVAEALPQVKECGDATVRKLTTKYIDASW